MVTIKQVALQRVHILFNLAKECIKEDPALAQRYVHLARKIAMSTRLHLPREYRHLICRKCKNFIMPGVNCRVRIQKTRSPHIVVTCFNCGECSRIFLKSEEKRC